LRASSVPPRSEVVVHRARSLSPVRASSPVRDVVPYTNSYTHVYGYRTPHIPYSYIDSVIMDNPYRPMKVTYTPKPLRGLDYETFYPYRSYGWCWGLPSDVYNTLERRRIRALLEPRFTSPVSSSIVPATRYSSATLASPVTRYISTPTRVYISTPMRHSAYPRNYLTVQEPTVYKTTHTSHKLGDGFPTRFQTYKVVKSKFF